MTDARYVLAKRYINEQRDRYFSGDCWGMEGDIDRAYVFRTLDEIDTALENMVRRYPSSRASDCQVYRVVLDPPPAPPHTRVLLGGFIKNVRV